MPHARHKRGSSLGHRTAQQERGGRKAPALPRKCWGDPSAPRLLPPTPKGVGTREAVLGGAQVGAQAGEPPGGGTQHADAGGGGCSSGTHGPRLTQAGNSAGHTQEGHSDQAGDETCLQAAN